MMQLTLIACYIHYKPIQGKENKMKTVKLFFLIATVLLMAGCNILNLGDAAQMVDPSNVIITEERSVSDFTAIDFGTYGKVTITQGESESLTITGSDNVVPLVNTSVSNGTLTISTKEEINVLGLNSENILTFVIMVKDLAELTNSGAGHLIMDQLTADSLNVTLSGAGNIKLAGEAETVRIDISGAGIVTAPDLMIKTTEVILSGTGGAEIWVTDLLTGTIRGVGDVRYYGEPQVDTEKTGIGSYKSLGNK
jgi:hypothetical protein